MDPAIQKLVVELISLRRNQMAIESRISTINTALEIMGIKQNGMVEVLLNLDTQYMDQRPFGSMTITDGCLKILGDHKDFDVWLSKSTIEYLLTIGGLQFKGQDPTNSVDIALRRLAAAGKCSSRKREGAATGHEYQFPEERTRDAISPKARATKKNTAGDR